MARHGLFTKEQLASQFGLSEDAIDRYVAHDLLYPLQIEGSTLFTSSDFLRVEIIQKGLGLGFSFEEIRQLMMNAKKPN